MSSSEKLATVHRDLQDSLDKAMEAAKRELVGAESAPAHMTRLLGHISAAQQITTMIMAKLQAAQRIDAQRIPGKDLELDRKVARMKMGRDALLSSLENLSNDLKTSA